MYREMENEGSDYLFLDARYGGGSRLEERFPGIFEKCMSVGLDIRREPIPVVPAAHYFCGGVKVGLHGTHVGGRAVRGGRDGVHRRARRQPAGLGLPAGRPVLRPRGGQGGGAQPRPGDGVAEEEHPRLGLSRSPRRSSIPVLIQQDMLNIQSTMWNYAGIIRNRKRLERALADLNYLSHRIEQFYRQAKVSRSIIELRNAVLSAQVIVLRGVLELAVPRAATTSSRTRAAPAPYFPSQLLQRFPCLRDRVLGLHLVPGALDQPVLVDEKRRADDALVSLAVVRLLPPDAVSLRHGVVGVRKERKPQGELHVELLLVRRLVGADARARPRSASSCPAAHRARRTTAWCIPGCPPWDRSRRAPCGP